MRVKLILNCPRAHAITYTNESHKCVSACLGSNNSLLIFTTQQSLENLKVLTLDFVLFVQFIAAQNTMIFRFKRSHRLGELQN